MFLFPSPYLLILFSGEGTPSSREVGGGEDKPSHPPIFLCPAPLPPISISLLGKRERVKEQGMGRIGARCLIFPSPYYLLILFSSEGTGGHGVHYLTPILLPSTIHTYQQLPTPSHPDLTLEIREGVWLQVGVGWTKINQATHPSLFALLALSPSLF